MATAGEALRELHRLHLHARDLRGEIDRSPKVIQAHQNKLAKQEESVKLAQDGLKKLKVSILEKESALKQKNGQIAKHERQLNEAGDKKQYDALKTEVAHEKEACSKLEDEILEAMTQVDAESARLPDLDKDLKKAREETARLIAELQTRRNDLTGRLAEVHKELAAALTLLPPEAKPQYERQMAARSDDALAAVENRTCMACYTEVTAQNYNELARGMFFMCKSCGRMLYVKE